MNNNPSWMQLGIDGIPSWPWSLSLVTLGFCFILRRHTIFQIHIFSKLTAEIPSFNPRFFQLFQGHTRPSQVPTLYSRFLPWYSRFPPCIPGSYPSIPGSYPGIPGSYPGIPGSYPNIPGWIPLFQVFEHSRLYIILRCISRWTEPVFHP